MSEELKPCPFCGSTEVYVEEYEHHPGAMRWRVLCAGCMAGIDTGTRQSAGMAVQDWNRRAERTCRMEYNEQWSHDEYYPTECYNCSECGHMTYDGVPTFCPNCGARVIEEGV